MDWIVSKINEKFQDKYNFLKTYSVVYNQQKKTCCVTFLYPENKFLSDDDKNVLAEYVAEALSLKGETTVKFKKSYLDEELIIKAFLNFVKNQFPSILGFIDKDTISVERNFAQSIIKIKVDSEFLNLISEEEIKKQTKKQLEKQFITEIFLEIEKAEIAKDIELRPKETFKPKIPRYDVEEKRNLFGGEIAPHPEFIKNIKGEKKSVILAGKIENFEKKSYEVKKGKNAGKQKNYFAFTLFDTTARIDVRYFTTISNEKQMDKLLSGDQVLIMGDVEEFNRKLTLYIKSISRCVLPEKIEFKQPISKDYEVVEIVPYSILSQENIFKKTIIFNPFIEHGDFVVFDVETTGLNYETDELLEIGAVKIHDGKIVSKFQSLIKPRNPIPPSATAINNITDSMVASSPRADAVVRDFYRYTRGCGLVGYNVGFDQKFVLQEAKRQNIVFDNEFIDLLPIAKSKLRLPHYKLSDVVKRLEITLDGAHRAYADALATAEAFLKLNSEEYA